MVRLNVAFNLGVEIGQGAVSHIVLLASAGTDSMGAFAG